MGGGRSDLDMQKPQKENREGQNVEERHSGQWQGNGERLTKRKDEPEH